MKDCKKCIWYTKVIPCGADTDEKCEKLYTSKLSVALDTFVDIVKTILMLLVILVLAAIGFASSLYLYLHGANW